MVAIVGGNGFGLLNGSAGVLGQQGLFGNGTFGTTKEGAYVNVVNGNLTLQDTDGFLASTGLNLAYTRTYNSQGNFGSGRGKGWTDGLARLNGAPASGAAGVAASALVPFTRTAGDGSVSTFTYDATRGAYVSTDGGGAYQTIRWSATDAKWHWTDGRDDDKEMYEAYDAAGRLVAAGDAGGVRTSYSYDTAGRLQAVISDGGQTGYAYGTLNPATNTRTTTVSQTLGANSTYRTTYVTDNLDRLVRVVTDLTPGDATDAQTYTVSYAYDGASNRVTSVMQGDGSRLTVTYDGEQVKSVTEHDNSGMPDRVTTFGYTTVNGVAVTTVADALGNVTTYTADTQGRLVSVAGPQTDAVPLKLTFTYDAAKNNGDVQSVTDAAGRSTWFEYDSHGNCILQRDAVGNTITRTFRLLDPANPAKGYTNELLTETLYAVPDPDGAGAGKPAQPMTSRNVYYTAAGKTHLVRYAITAQGRVTEYTYNAAGERTNEWTYMSQAYATAGLGADVAVTEAQVVAWVSSSAAAAGLISRTDYAYTRGLATSVIRYATAPASTSSATGTTVTYSYDMAGNLVQAIDGNRAAVSTYTYDGLGRMLSKTEPAGRTTYTYSANTTSTSTLDPSGVTTLRVYDSAGRLLAVTQSKNAVSSVARNVYDAAGRLRMSVDAAGRKTVLLYDGAGRKAAEVGPDGALTEFVYDGGAQPIRTIRYATTVNAAALLGAGDVPRDDVALAAVRPAATAFDRIERARYDSAGRLSATVDAEGALTRYAYDGAGRLVATTRRANPLVLLSPTAGIPDDSAAEASALDQVARTLYNADGAVVAKLDPMGYLTEYVYDAGGRLTDSIAYANAAAGNPATGTLAQLRPAADPADIREHKVYDGRGNVAATVDGDYFVTEYEYDGNNNVTRKTRYATPSTNPAGNTLALVRAGTTGNPAENRITRYEYNTLNQLKTESTVNGSNTVIGNVTTYNYDLQGNVTSVVRTGGATAVSRYDELGRLIGVAAAPGAPETTYAYNGTGQRISMTDANGNRTLYFYDVAGRLTHTVNALGEVAESTYTAFGQLAAERRYGSRVDVTRLQPGVTATLTALLSPAVTDTRAFHYYDRDGRLIYTIDSEGSIAGRQYDTFDQAVATSVYTTALGGTAVAGLTGGSVGGALKELLKLRPAATTRYTYDADGRLSYSVNALGEAQGRTYDAFGRVRQSVQYATRNATQPVASQQDSAVNYAYDHRGNVLSFVDAQNQAVVSTYNAFGQVNTVRRAGTFVANAAVVQDTIERTFYDTEGRVTAKIDGAGALTLLTYDGNNNVTEQVTYATPLTAAQAAGATSATVRTLATANAALDARQRSFYDVQGRRIALLSSRGTNGWSVQTFGYDAFGNVAERKAFSTTMVTSAPTADGVAIWAAEATRNIAIGTTAADSPFTRMAYDSANRLIATATLLKSGEWSVVGQHYDALGRVDVRTAYAGVLRSANPTPAQIAATGISAFDAVVRYTYDSAGRVVATATAQGTNDGDLANGAIRWALVSKSYDQQGRVISQTEYATALTSNEPPADLRTVIKADAADRTTRFAYDAAGRLRASADPMGAVTGIEYDAKGNAIRSTAYATPVNINAALPAATGADRVTRTVYDRNGRAVYVIDATGAVTERRYDALGNVTTVVRYADLPTGTLPDEPKPEDVAARLNVANANNRTQRYVYDQAGRVRYAIDAAGYIAETQYDAVGRIKAELQYKHVIGTATDATIASVAAAAAAAQVADTRPAVWPRKTTYTYDAQGNRLTVTDALNFTESYTYDALGRKLTFRNKLGNTWSYAYDTAGHLLSETAPPAAYYGADGTTTTMGAWGAGTTAALQTVMTYDVLGNVTSRTEGVGSGQERLTEYFYDLAGRQTGTRQPAVNVYDPGKDPRTWNTASAGPYESPSLPLSTTVTYNIFGEAVSNKDVGGKVSYKIYDKRGQVSYELDALKYVTSYARNTFGETETLTRYAATWTEVAGLDLAKAQPADFARGVTAGASDRAVATRYDANGRAVRVSEAVVSVYDPRSTTGTPYLDAGKVTLTDYNAFGEVARVQRFGADASGRQVTSAAESSFWYDVRGNKSAQLDKVDQQGSVRSGYLSTYAYDAVGNLELQTEYGNPTATWSLDGYTLPATSTSDRVTRYTYDAMSQRTSETRVGVAYYNGTTAASGDVSATTVYDAVGNVKSVTDAQGVRSVSYRDALGRVTATARYGANAANNPFTEFKMDAFGNVVLRIDYATAAPADTGATPVATSAMMSNAANRVTATAYDRYGRAIRTVDAEQYSKPVAQRSAVVMSYDIYGRIARKAQVATDTWGAQRVVYEISNYDAIGRLIVTEKPGNRNQVDNTDTGNIAFKRSHNAFGEIESTWYTDGAGDHAMESSRYDQAGRAWLTNAGDGVWKVTLFDALGNASVQLVANGTDKNQLPGLTGATGALALAGLQRTETRYDLLGRKIDVRLVDSMPYGLVRDPFSGEWTTEPLGQTAGASPVMLVGDIGMTPATVRVLYRLKGSGEWIDQSAVRLRAYGDYTGFNTAGLAGEYEYKVQVTPPGEPMYERSGGGFTATATPSREVNAQVARVYALVLNRAADLAGLNFYVERLNQGYSLADLIGDFLASDEGKARFTGTSTQIMQRLLEDAFGRTGANDPTYAADLATWSARWEAVRNNNDAGRGRVLLELIDSVTNYTGTVPALANARARQENRIHAALRYSMNDLGTDSKSAAQVFELALTDLAGALALADRLTVTETRTRQIAQVYLTLFGRAAEPTAVSFWLDNMNRPMTIEQVAAAILESVEARDPLLYPSEGLTPDQYRRQLIPRVFQNMLGRPATAAELDFWLNRLSGNDGSPAISAGMFVVQLADRVSTYSGADNAALADKRLFNNRLAIALGLAQVPMTGVAEADYGAVAKAAIAAVTSADSAKAALAQALATAGATATVAAAVKTATAAAAAATPLEDMRVQLSRLYVALLNRTPDSSGFDYQLAIIRKGGAAAVADAFLVSAESTGDTTLPGGATLSPLQFVQRIYTLALGQLPTSAGAQAEMAAFAAQLASRSRGAVAVDIVNNLMSFKGVTADEAQLKARFDNKVAVGVACAVDFSAFDWAGASQNGIGRAVLQRVTATDTAAALTYAYGEARTAFMANAAATLTAAGQARGAVQSASDATRAAIAAATAVQTAAAGAAGQPDAGMRVKIMQLYVGLLGRDQATLQRDPDVDGFNFQVTQVKANGMAQVAQGFIASAEGQKLYGAETTNAGFVRKVFATMLPGAVPMPGDVDAWVAKMAGSTPLSRGQVALGILESLVGYANYTPDATAGTYLAARSAFAQRVADCFTTLNTAQQQAITNDATQLRNLRDQQAEVQRLLEASNTAATAQGQATQAATAALNTANGLGDGSANRRLQITRLYVTLLPRATPRSLGEINFHIDRGLGLAAIAQNFLDSPEASGVYPADNTAFVTKLYSMILGRQPDANDNVADRASRLASGQMTRGAMALDMLQAFVSYTDSKPAQLDNRQAFDRKVTDYLAAQKTEADNAYNNAALLAGTRKTERDNALAAYQSASALVTQRRDELTVATESARRGQAILNYPSQTRDVIEAYIGLRGRTDMLGVGYQVALLGPGSISIFNVIGALLSAESYSTDPRQFVTELYRRVLGREPDSGGMATHLDALARGASRETIANNFIISGEARTRNSTSINASVSSDTTAARAAVNAKPGAETAYSNALRAEPVAKDSYNAAETAYGIASEAETKARSVKTVTAGMVTAHDKVALETGARLKAANALDTYTTKQAAFAPYAPTLAKLEAALNHAAATGATKPIAAAAAQQAKADADVAAAYVANASMSAPVRSGTRVAQLYLALMNRPPLLTELVYWTGQLNSGMSLAAAAQAIMTGPGAALYPAGQSDATFVTQLFNNSLNRGFADDPTGLQFWTAPLTGPNAISRAQLVENWITAVPRNNNVDSLTFNARVAATLQSVIAAGAQGDLMPAVRLAEQGARDAALAYDSAAAAQVNAATHGAKMRPFTQLYLTVLGRAPDPSGLSFWASAMAKGMTLAEVAEGIATSPEGREQYPAGLSDAAYVRQILTRVLGRAPTDAESAPFLAAGKGRGQITLDIIAAYSSATDGDLVQVAARYRFNALVAATLADVAVLAAGHATATQQALVQLQKVAATVNVDSFATSAVVGTTTTLAAAAIADFRPNQTTLDRWGNVVAMTDPRDPNWKITYTYNHDNQQLTQTAIGLAGKSATMATRRYDSLGQLVGITDGKGYLTQYGYDSNGNLVTELHPDDGKVTNAYSLFGDRLSVTRSMSASRSVVTNYGYDHLGHLIRTETGAAVQVYVAPLTGTDNFASNAAVTQRLVETYQYDELGLRTVSINAAGEKTRQDYDASGNVITTVNALSFISVAAFDALGNRIATRDANQNTMHWTYDAFGRMTTQVDMGKNTTTYGYDAAGRKLTQTSTKGQNIIYTYRNNQLILVDDQGTGMVTGYRYDAAGNRVAEQQAYRGTAESTPSRMQNNRIVYDNLNRVVSVKDDAYEVTFEYDENGNRARITNKSAAGIVVSYNEFDKMNRQTLVDGDLVNGVRVYGQRGHAITYDQMGNRLTDTFKGVKITYASSRYATTGDMETKETYTYDDAGRLSTTTRDILTIDVRRYDAAGRITQSGLQTKGASGVSEALQAIGIGSAGRIYSYNAVGNITRQRDLKADLTKSQDTYFVSDQWNLPAGYDAVGNLTGYTIVRADGQKGRYVVDYEAWDSYKESATTLASGSSTTMSHYDANGNRTSITKGEIITQVIDPGTTTEQDGAIITIGQTTREVQHDTKVELNRLWYDADGHIQSHKSGSDPAQFNLIVNGQVLGEETANGKTVLGSTYLPITNASLSAAPSSYSVQSTSETLQSIAQNLWGDANLWYMIADANALASDTKLTPGQVLRIPARVNTVHGDYATYKPYDPSAQIGSTAPEMPPPQGKGGGCGAIGQIVMIVVAVVATAMTGGALAGPMAAALGSTGGAIAAGAIAGAVGSIASQAVGIAIGAQDGFSWKGVALAAIGGGVAGGVTDVLGKATSLSGSVGRAVLTNTISQGVGIVTGLQNGFNWRSVAASAAGSAAGYQAGEMLSKNDIFGDLFSGEALQIARSTASGFVSGTTMAIVRGGKIDMARIATDAFGNALGSSLSEPWNSADARPETRDGRSRSVQTAIMLASEAYLNQPADMPDIQGLLDRLPEVESDAFAYDIDDPRSVENGMNAVPTRQDELRSVVVRGNKIEPPTLAAFEAVRQKATHEFLDGFTESRAFLRGEISVVRNSGSVTLVGRPVVMASEGYDAFVADVEARWKNLSYTDENNITYKTDLQFQKTTDMNKANVFIEYNSRYNLRPGANPAANGQLYFGTDELARVRSGQGFSNGVAAHEFAHAFFGVKDAYYTLGMDNGWFMAGVSYPKFEKSLMADPTQRMRGQDLKDLTLKFEGLQKMRNQKK